MLILDNKKNIRSFGRINGRGITEETKNILENKLEQYKFVLENFNKNNINHLEIGFGYGESIAERAKNNKNIKYIGCEIYTKGVLNLINLMENNKTDNIQIFNGDARLLFETLPDNSLDMVFILFSDPWPKKKQRKRRIISDDFLVLLSQKIKIGGSLFFASDIENYVEWTIEKVNNNECFKKLFDNEGMMIEPKWWVKTKYQEKAIREGRKSCFLEWKRI